MRIDDLRPDRLNSGNVRPPAAPSRRSAAAGSTDAGTRGDSVEISEEARSLAALAEGDVVDGTLPPEKLAGLRRWLAAGGHNDPAVLQHVAARLLDSTDLQQSEDRDV